VREVKRDDVAALGVCGCVWGGGGGRGVKREDVSTASCNTFSLSSGICYFFFRGGGKDFFELERDEVSTAARSTFSLSSGTSEDFFWGVEE